MKKKQIITILNVASVALSLTSMVVSSTLDDMKLEEKVDELLSKKLKETLKK